MNEIEPTDGATLKKRWPWSWLSSWTRAEWVPVGLLVLGCGILYWLLPIPLNGMESDNSYIYVFIVVSFFGISLSQQIVCAFWGAMAPAPLAWRVPIFFCSLHLLHLVAYIYLRDHNYLYGFNYLPTIIGLNLWALLSIIRWLTKRQLTTNKSHVAKETHFQFSIIYLLFWTSIAALLLQFGKTIGLYNSVKDDGLTLASKVVMPFIAAMPMTVILIPAIFALFFPFRESISFRIKSLLFLLSVLICIATVAIALVGYDRNFVTLSYIAGSLLYTFSAGFALRWAGYRIEKAPERS